MVIEVKAVGRVERVSIGSPALRFAHLLLGMVVGTGVVEISAGRSWSPPTFMSL